MSDKCQETARILDDKDAVAPRSKVGQLTQNNKLKKGAKNGLRKSTKTRNV